MGGVKQKYSATNFSVSGNFCKIHFNTILTKTPVTMASVYKSVSKKAAQQPEDSSDEDIQMEEYLDGENDTTDSEEEESEDEGLEAVKKQLASGFMPKTRVLILTSRGASYRYVQCASKNILHKSISDDLRFLQPPTPDVRYLWPPPPRTQRDQA